MALGGEGQIATVTKREEDAAMNARRDGRTPCCRATP